MNAYGTARLTLTPIKHVRLYLDEMTRGWWPDVPTRCEHCRGTYRVDPPQDGYAGRIFCLACSRGPQIDVLDTRRVVTADLSADYVCRRCGARRATGAGRVAEHWKHELCSCCWETRRGRR